MRLTTASARWRPMSPRSRRSGTQASRQPRTGWRSITC
jgi:hypothetical protein